MLNSIINLVLRTRWLVIGATVVLIGAGLWALFTIPVDAFPDLTNNQVVIVTEAPSFPPTEVERQITYPIEIAMLGMPNQTEVRSLSKLGLSMVTVVFEDSVPYYFARQLVNERLQQASGTLPLGIQPVLSPPATAFGELYQYTLEGRNMSPMELKDLQEWVIKNQLRTVPGVSDVNAWGGQSKQFQIKVDPALLAQYSMDLHDVVQRVEENNRNFGGGYIEHASEQYTLRGSGRASTTEDLGNIVLMASQGSPVLLRDVAEITIAPAPRKGATLRNAETVSGTVIMLKGENGKRVIRGIKQKIAGLHLPAGVKLVPFYDQSEVIDGTTRTVTKNLFEGFLLVTIVLFVFLGNVRAAILTALVIPLSMLVSFLGMRAYGISANLMSLGAIDFGMIVDGAIVMMENSVHRLESREHETESPIEAIRRAAHEIARPMVFGVAIIIAVYLPILFLQGLEGRLEHGAVEGEKDAVDIELLRGVGLPWRIVPVVGRADPRLDRHVARVHQQGGHVVNAAVAELLQVPLDLPLDEPLQSGVDRQPQVRPRRAGLDDGRALEDRTARSVPVGDDHLWRPAERVLV